MSESTEKIYKHTDTVLFIAEYPKNFTKKKHLKDGVKYKLHILHADRLEAKGIGKIIK
jgi:hypothetical protein